MPPLDDDLDLTARPGEADDQDGAVEVWRAAQAARGRRPNAERVDRVRAKLTADDALLAVVTVGDEVVAMALGEPGRRSGGPGDRPGRGDPVPGLLHLSMLFVHPSRRRRGVGGAVLERLTDDAWRVGYREVAVWTRTDNRPGTAFYAACGLEPDGTTSTLEDGTTAHRLTAELAPPVREVVVRTDGLRLGQLLKLAGLADTGTEARQLVTGGQVSVNGEIDTRRGRQMMDGDEVEVAGLGAVRVVAAG